MEENNIFKMRRIALSLLYLSIIMFILGAIRVIFGIIGGLCISSFFYLSLVYWRCPTCTKGLPIRHSSIDKAIYCPYCGNKLINDTEEASSKNTIVLLILVIVFAIICTLYAKKEISKEDAIKANIIDSLKVQTLEILQGNEEVKKYIGASYEVISEPMELTIEDTYLMVIEGDKKDAWIWIIIDDNNEISQIKVSEDDKEIVIRVNN